MFRIMYEVTAFYFPLLTSIYLKLKILIYSTLHKYWDNKGKKSKLQNVTFYFLPVSTYTIYQLSGTTPLNFNSYI